MGISFLNLFKRKTGEERRLSPRHKKIFIAQCETYGKKSFSTVVDVSKIGLGIYLEKQVEIGTHLNITLQHEFINGAYDSRLVNILIPAKIVWINEEIPSADSPNAGEKRFRAGLEVEALSPEMEKKFRAIMQEEADPS